MTDFADDPRVKAIEERLKNASSGTPYATYRPQVAVAPEDIAFLLEDRKRLIGLLEETEVRVGQHQLAHAAAESEVARLQAVIAAVETLCNTAIEHKDRVLKNRDTGPLERSAAIEAGHFASEVRAALSTGKA